MESLFNSLMRNKPYEIDFIYGSSDEMNCNRYFQPVDGQQRLTTLALIGWILNQKTNMAFANTFHPITYTSRPSSEQFCEKLFGYRLPENYGSISSHITHIPGWFSDRWLSDPTVNAMLEFLDKADTMLSSEPYSSHVEEMAERFFTKSPIEFELLDMKALHLNDDLYIKMNARGKLLTPFENWKAEFEEHLNANFKDIKYGYGFVPDSKETPSLLQYFEYAIEHEWCNLIWPIAYGKWEALSDSDKRKVIYPRIDEYFMNLLDYISRFLFFASIKDAEKERETKKLKEVRLLYDRERDKMRMSVYRTGTNIELLFRILDNLVIIQKNFNNFNGFFEKYFISSNNKLESTILSDFRVNLFDAPSVDLMTLCFENRLQATTEVILWAVMHWLLTHPECLENGVANETMTDYLRIMMGWARGRRQRLTQGLNVNTNLRLANYYEANNIITALAEKDTNLFETLSNLQNDSLASEREKGVYYSTENFKAVRLLSKCPELYYSFNLLIPSLNTTNDIDNYISRFNEFIMMKDEQRIRALNNYGFKGISPLYNHYFFGVEGKWDFIFTIGSSDDGFDNAIDAFTSWMNNSDKKQFSISEMAYYIDKYPQFIQARYNHQYGGNPCHYFVHRPENEFSVWAVKTFSTQPIRGYNVNPYDFTVENLYDGAFELEGWSDNSEPGILHVNETDLTMQCVEEGWMVKLVDCRRKACRSFLKRFSPLEDENGNITYEDNMNEFTFEGNILLNLYKKDRIETALLFLECLE